MNYEKVFRNWYLAFSGVIFFVVAWRCYLVPFSHDEVASFFFYIQPGDFVPFKAHPDANGHFLTNLSSWFCFKLFGSSTFSLRIPNLIALIIMLFSVYRLAKNLTSSWSRLLLICLLPAAWNFLAYFVLCRGYGISMAFLLLALAYTFDYFETKSPAYYVTAVTGIILALSANLTLLPLTGLFFIITVVFQLLQKQLLKPVFLIGQILLVTSMIFWANYAVYLKNSGALYYGAGDSYWKTSFQSLIDSMFFPHPGIYYLVIAAFTLFSLSFIYQVLIKRQSNFLSNRFFTTTTLLMLLVIAFYLMKHLLGINYPEDRTGLFFYLLFVLAGVYFIDAQTTWLLRASGLISLVVLLQSIYLLNFEVHPWRVYETMPKRFFDRLLSEQEHRPAAITVGGHRVREFFYGFLNYNSPVKLNHMTAPEALQMNTDYAIAYKQDAPYYNHFYDEIDQEPYWGFRLLKRKQALIRDTVYSHSNYQAISGAFEYYNLFEIQDTTFLPGKPIQGEVTFSCQKASVPLLMDLVMQIESADPSEGTQFVRVPLNLIDYNWNGKKGFTTSIVSGNLPKKCKRLVIYFWNIKQTESDITIHKFNLYQLIGAGVSLQSKAAI